MLNIDETIKTAFLTDSTPKELTIESLATYRNHSKLIPYGHVMSANRTFQNNTLLPPANPGVFYGIYPKDNTLTTISTMNFLDENNGIGDTSNITDFDYLCIAFSFCIDFDDLFPQHSPTFNIRCQASSTNDGHMFEEIKTFNSSDFETLIVGEASDFQQIYFIVPTTYFRGNSTKLLWLDFSIPNTETDPFIGSIYVNYVGIYVGNYQADLPFTYKTYSIYDIDSGIAEINLQNDHLLSESFSLNESLCSEENIKFGLCEAAYCQFTATDDYHEFKDRVIKPKIRLIDSTGELAHIVLKQANLFGYEGESSTTNWPQPGTALTLTWNNSSLTTSKTVSDKLDISISESARTHLSEYQYIRVTFQVKITNLSASPVTPAKIIFYPRVRVDLNSGTTMGWTTFWSTDAQLSAQENCVALVTSLLAEYTTLSFDVPINYGEYYAALGDQDVIDYGVTTLHNLKDIAMRFIDADGNFYTDSTQTVTLSVSYQNLQVNFIDSKYDTTPEYSTKDCVEFYGETLDDYVDRATGSIPLGVFTVNSVKKNYTNDILKQEITAYDRLTLLEQNAADWYTQYMFGMDSDTGKSTPGLEYSRQIFATYFNYVTGIELDSKDNYTETVISHNEYLHANYIPQTSDIAVSWTDSQTARAGYLKYTKYTISSINPNKLYVVNVSPLKDMDYLKPYVAQTNYFDSLNRGLITGNILISEDTGNKYCVDPGDYFMVSPDCTELTIFVAIRLVYIGPSGTGVYVVGDSDSANITIDICEVNFAPDLSNGHTRLLYYNYDTKEIFACDSSITGRDVVRSLLEVNGCFYRLNRYTGKPEFVYCNKSGLYPRNDLYPADDLYPRLGSNQTINMSQYQSFIQEDYEVQRYGRIQILKNITSNQTKSVVEWEYTGDKDFKNSYLIEDNIFYCNEKMEYDYDGMPEVSSMLENMWLRISNMNYVPCVLKCMGMPWIECGDRIGTLTKTGGAETFVFHRTLTGIQSLIDTFESEGDEYNKEVKDYGYKEWEG